MDGYLKATKKYRGRMERVVMQFFSVFVEQQKLDHSQIRMAYSPGFSRDLMEELTGKA
ncbi:MAG: hypothetical protein ACI32N_04470 [Bulleidia sp.]